MGELSRVLGTITLLVAVLIVAGGVFLWLRLTESTASLSAQTDSQAGTGTNQSEPGSDETDGKPAELPWKAWEKPAFAIILSGEQQGYFEPCGCTGNQLGGMARRANLAKKIREAGWNIFGVDLGALSRRTGTQAGLKLNTSLDALKTIGYEGAGLGIDELKLGIDGLIDVQMAQSNSEEPFPFISANVTLLDGALEGFPSRYRIREIDDMKVGITSVISKSAQKEVFPMSEGTWTPPEPELEKILSEFASKGVGIRILLSHGTVEESKALAKQFPQFQVVMTTNGVGDPDPNAQPQKVGEASLIEVGRQGKHVGLMAVYTSDDGPEFRYQLISLEGDAFSNEQSMVDLMQSYQNRLKEDRVVVTDGIGAVHPSGATFVGADKCGECHTTAYDIWKKTPHAHALESLDPTNNRDEGRLNGVDRTFDPECLACHVTGWDPVEYTRFKSGFLNEEFATTDTEKDLHKILAGNQCENCHGPGSKHIQMVENDEPNPAESVLISKTEAEKHMCGRCHDPDNSPKFDFEPYWKKVEHVGLD